MPRQEPLGGDDGQMRRLKAEADRVILDAKARKAPFDEAAAALYLSMRPTFGPANAWLFNERGRKLLELARALGVEPPAEPPAHLDGWAQTVEQARAALVTAQLRVVSEPGHSGQLGWRPRVFGRRLVVEDPRRTTTSVPYAELRHEGEPVKPAPLRLTLWLLPLVPLRAEISLVSREQPAELLGALEGATVFVHQPPQGGDVDDGRLLEAVRGVLFPGAKPGERPGVRTLETGDDTAKGPERVGTRRTLSGAQSEVELVPLGVGPR